jgi:hypothetical protein
MWRELGSTGRKRATNYGSCLLLVMFEAFQYIKVFSQRVDTPG